MDDAQRNSKADFRRRDAEGVSVPPSANERRRTLSMHEGIAIWCDCCSCEAEPYWIEAAEAMGMNLSTD
jgi:hypothetical protein